MGVNKLPSLKDYWPSQEKFEIPTSPKFSLVIGAVGYSVTWILQIIPYNQKKRTCKVFYSPSEFQVIKESMIKYQGRSSMKQYMPAKPTKRRYKVGVCTDGSGFVCEFQIYNGKVGDLLKKDLGGRVVKNLTKDLKNKNYKVVFDNYFTSMPLAWDLKQHHIYYCGTLKKGKKYLANVFIDDKRLGDNMIGV
nr:unnamed protein product [Callosobruchus analis]